MSEHWTRINLLHYTEDRQINAEWSESVPSATKQSEFLRFTVPIDQVVRIITGEILQTKIYEAGGDEIARESRGLITSLAPNKVLAKEIVEFDYPYDISWHDQQAKFYRDELKVNLPDTMPIIVFMPGSALIFNILSTSTVPSTVYTETRFSYHVQLFDGSYAQFIEYKTRMAVVGDVAKVMGKR
ncbi:unnamed protein product [marine sediment metagenome]|uniref:Uncharacterized protein n=1 Tax=marine sediment metagenome TaxID=412755 RepID=X1KA82_9ZZZZ